MTQEKLSSATSNAECGSQFLAKAILTASYALHDTLTPESRERAIQDFKEHMQCAQAHYDAMFEILAESN